MIVPVPRQMSFHDLLELYRQRSRHTVPEIIKILRHKVGAYKPAGFMLAECESMDSRYYGYYTINAYGGEYGYTGPLEGFLDLPGLDSLWAIIATTTIESFDEYLRHNLVAL